jgi:hypothetical protein
VGGEGVNFKGAMKGRRRSTRRKERRYIRSGVEGRFREGFGKDSASDYIEMIVTREL